MDLCVVGTGYVGLVVGACLADFGHHVTCVDSNAAKVAHLESGGIPIFEPGLDDVVDRNRERGRLKFTTDLAAAVAGADVHFIAVGTPSSDDGSADLSGVFAVAAAIGRNLVRRGTIVTKSTVPVGTADKVRAIVAESTTQPFDVVSNPEFLAEGTAVDDFTRPDRIVVGYGDPASGPVMDRLYAPLVRTGRPIHHMDNRSAEMSKYASNAMLATRITFMNELANLCERVGADIDAVRRVVGGDSRIGSRFLFPGCGYGGSCFPKDVQALAFTAQEADFPLRIVSMVHQVNEDQKKVLAAKLRAVLGDDWSGRRVAVWGLAFKPRTDDVREAPALVFAEEALARGAEVVAFDPEAMDQTREHLGDRIGYADDALTAIDGADALVIPTDWNAFRSPDFDEVRERMRGRVIIDGRNLYDPKEMAELGFVYHCIGRPHVAPVEGGA
jgi:UDPglucose 6-dehydrogenase